METSSPTPDPLDRAAKEPGGGSTTGAPTWVKVFGVIAFVLLVLMIVSMLTGGGGHGPGRHGSGDPAPTVTVGQTPSGADGGGGHAPPAGAGHVG